MDLKNQSTKKIIFIIAVAVFFLWIALNHETVIAIFSYLLGLIMPFIVGICMAFIFNVLMRAIETKIFIHISYRVDEEKKSGKIWNAVQRPLSLILTLILIFGIITVIVLLVIPELKNSIELLISDIPDYMDMIEGWYYQVTDYFGIDSDIELPQMDWNQVLSQVGEFLGRGASDFGGAAAQVTSAVFNGVTSTVLGFVFAIYMLLKKETLERQTKRLMFAYVPEKKAKDIMSIGKLANEIFAKFIAGEFIQAVIIGVLTFITMTVIGFFVDGMPFKLMISILIGFTALIPVVGAIIGTIIGFLLILIDDPLKAIIFVIAIIVIQQFEGNLIYPKVVGKSIGLPGIWVLLAVLVGGSAYGILGMIIAVPIFSVLYVLLKRSVRMRMSKKKIDIDEVEPKDFRRDRTTNKE